MKNYEVIQKMNADEMASIFYMFLNPMLEEFKVSKEEKQRTKERIKEFLNKDIQKK